MLRLLLLIPREVDVELLGHLLPTLFHLSCVTFPALLHVLTPCQSRVLAVQSQWHWALHEAVVGGFMATVAVPVRRELPLPGRR